MGTRFHSGQRLRLQHNKQTSQMSGHLLPRFIKSSPAVCVSCDGSRYHSDTLPKHIEIRNCMSVLSKCLLPAEYLIKVAIKSLHPQDMYSQCWVDVGPASKTVGQHQHTIAQRHVFADMATWLGGIGSER